MKNMITTLRIITIISIILYVLPTIRVSAHNINSTSFQTNRIHLIASKRQLFEWIQICGYSDPRSGNRYICESSSAITREYDSKNWFRVDKPIKVGWRIHNDPNIKELQPKPQNIFTLPTRKSNNNPWSSLVGGRYKKNAYSGYRKYVNNYLFTTSPIVNQAY